MALGGEGWRELFKKARAVRPMMMMMMMRGRYVSGLYLKLDVHNHGDT